MKLSAEMDLLLSAPATSSSIPVASTPPWAVALKALSNRLAWLQASSFPFYSFSLL